MSGEPRVYVRQRDNYGRATPLYLAWDPSNASRPDPAQSARLLPDQMLPTQVSAMLVVMVNAAARAGLTVPEGCQDVKYASYPISWAGKSVGWEWSREHLGHLVVECGSRGVEHGAPGDFLDFALGTGPDWCQPGSTSMWGLSLAHKFSVPGDAVKACRMFILYYETSRNEHYLMKCAAAVATGLEPPGPDPANIGFTWSEPSERPDFVGPPKQRYLTHTQLQACDRLLTRVAGITLKQYVNDHRQHLVDVLRLRTV